jgi:hypothetical protein
MFVQSVIVLSVLCFGTMTTTLSSNNVSSVKNVPAYGQLDTSKLTDEDQALLQHFDREFFF